MGRPNRICFPGAVYHIYQRGNNKESIFLDDADRWYMLKLFLEAKKQFGCFLYCYVLLNNHFHFTVETPNAAPISRIMHFVEGAYAHYFNKKNDRVGHVFQSRFRDILVEKDAYLLELSRYIHLNPVRAGLVKQPEQYFWSSYPVYTGARRDILVDTATVLSYFGKACDDNTRQWYEDFVNQQTLADTKGRDWLDDNLLHRRFLCSRDFLKSFQKSARHF